MDAANEEILRQVFGDSSDGEDLELGDGSDPSHCWEPIKEIKGLWLCRDFLPPQRQSSLLSTIQNEGWFTQASHNQAMRFGDLPSWAAELSHSIRKVVLASDFVLEPIVLGSTDNVNENACSFPSDLFCREPLFDQLILNSYQPGEGICAHIDLMRFEDGIAILSLESSCVMHFSSVDGTSRGFLMDGEKDPAMAKIPVYLTPGSLIFMSGEARYLWKHEINRMPGFQKWEGEELNQKRRISITLRKLCQVE
ncbi:unnamed protein product [Prunus armeniaca]|uniref:Fe2OG dioxygenase domain-containing protein n=1 Tax=Prunus armeniaca TaxID=36596 RepID=A0A6J5XGF5_PRUAR|nr:unnamed protein product [Prunus armeniaca]CAB4312041.1 unnamed protein product [Prunus armeniaca]